MWLFICVLLNKIKIKNWKTKVEIMNYKLIHADFLITTTTIVIIIIIMLKNYNNEKKGSQKSVNMTWAIKKKQITFHPKKSIMSLLTKIHTKSYTPGHYWIYIFFFLRKKSVLNIYLMTQLHTD